MATLVLDTVAQPHVLTIAGSDPSGGAGIQADLKTATAFGCYGSSVITALTAQNTLGVKDVHVVPPDFVIEQLQCIFEDDMRPAAAKFGMLAGAPTISALAAFFAKLPEDQRPYLVLDPVMISTSGHNLLGTDAASGDAARAALVNELLPLVNLLTPNIPEAQLLAGQETRDVSSLDEMLSLADIVRNKTKASAVLLKGGHAPLGRKDVREAVKARSLPAHWPADEAAIILDFRGALNLEPVNPRVVVDVLVDAAGTRLFVAPFFDSKATHGTGCTLSAALASSYAKQAAVSTPSSGPKTLTPEGVATAIGYTQAAIASAHPLGRGHGPLNHLHMTAPRPIPPPTKLNPTPFMSYLIGSCPELWDEYVRHPFVVQLGNGTLPLEAFKHYIAQDYHYLRHYARAHAMGAFKASDFDTIQAFSAIALHIAQESEMHVEFCNKFGISLAELKAMPESAACSAYARYVLDVASQGDVLDAYVAVLSCLVGYGEVGLWLRECVADGTATRENNPYTRWMDDYGGDDFIGAVRRGINNLETRIAADPPSPRRLAQLTHIFQECTRLERNFWQMGLDQSW